MGHPWTVYCRELSLFRGRKELQYSHLPGPIDGCQGCRETIEAGLLSRAATESTIPKVCVYKKMSVG
jgi:hypothetical protein